MTNWQKWIRQPQRVFLRRAMFQIHLWSGILIGLYVLIICLTGSVLVYRNELFRAFAPKPTIVQGSGDALAAEEIEATARRAYPGYEITYVKPGETPNHAFEVTLKQGDDIEQRLFHPFTGEDLGNVWPAKYRFTEWLLDLHDNLLAGDTGRQVNGVGAVLLVVLCVTGLVIWWPGSHRWRDSLTVNFRANWKRVNWSLHSALGFWLFGFVVLFSVTGIYLSFGAELSEFFDYLEPFDEENPAADRFVDKIQFWLAYLHFGRLGGRVPGCGRGLCNEITKGIWAIAGLVPPVLFVSGTLMWWNRVIRPRMLRRPSSPKSAA